MSSIRFNPIEDVPIDTLIVDRRIQRDTSEVRAQKIADSFEPNQYNPIMVARRTYGGRESVVVDGGHRLRAAQLLGVTSIPAQIVKVRDRREEARLFTSVNSNSKAVSPLEKFKVAVNGDSSSVEFAVNEIVRAAGVAVDSGRGNISFPGSLVTQYNTLGEIGFARALAAFIAGTPQGVDYMHWLFGGICGVLLENPNVGHVKLGECILRNWQEINAVYDAKRAVAAGQSAPRVVGNILIRTWNDSSYGSKRPLKEIRP